MVRATAAAVGIVAVAGSVQAFMPATPLAGHTQSVHKTQCSMSAQRPSVNSIAAAALAGIVVAGGSPMDLIKGHPEPPAAVALNWGEIFKSKEAVGPGKGTGAPPATTMGKVQTPDSAEQKKQAAGVDKEALQKVAQESSTGNAANANVGRSLPKLNNNVLSGERSDNKPGAL